MRVEVTEPKKFQPVKLVLETQEEVDKLFAIANFTPLAKLLDIENVWELLDVRKSEAYVQYHDLLGKYWKR